MIKEIEVKILKIDKKAIIARIKEKGGKKIFEDQIETWYFDTPKKTLQKRGNTLRIRREGSKTLIHVKKKQTISTTKNMEEYPLEVENNEKAKELLRALGYQEFEHLKKFRTSYQLKECRIDIDEFQEPYDFLPPLMEIEGPDPSTVFACAKALGISQEQLKPWNFNDVVTYYQKQKNP